ncbi:hypothetical protein HaLaN_21488 [Haematococcus lacustris]|uniref:Uncharacterized protein n=1 Tax=Haematococcus lacustris TaxID=44745 RepID=A0A699ZLX8_HAELA|nr:hypothetical protein HaLaN_21488 [Haematococcus lacustris]
MHRRQPGDRCTTARHLLHLRIMQGSTPHEVLAAMQGGRGGGRAVHAHGWGRLPAPNLDGGHSACSHHSPPEPTHATTSGRNPTYSTNSLSTWPLLLTTPPQPGRAAWSAEGWSRGGWGAEGWARGWAAGCGSMGLQGVGARLKTQPGGEGAGEGAGAVGGAEFHRPGQSCGAAVHVWVWHQRPQLGAEGRHPGQGPCGGPDRGGQHAPPPTGHEEGRLPAGHRAPAMPHAPCSACVPVARAVAAAPPPPCARAAKARQEAWGWSPDPDLPTPLHPHPHGQGGGALHQGGQQGAAWGVHAAGPDQGNPGSIHLRASTGPSLGQVVQHQQASQQGVSFRELEEQMAELSMKRHGHAKQLVVFFGAATIGTAGGWGADAVLRACRKVVCRPRGKDQDGGRVVLVDEHRTSRVSSAVNGKQPCEVELNTLSATRPAGWKPPAGQVEERLVRPAWSQERGQPVRGLVWCPAEPGAAEPTKGKGKGKAAKAKPAPQPGRWLDRDCNAALNMQRIGESRWRPLELCYWPEQGKLPAKGKDAAGLPQGGVQAKGGRVESQWGP